MAYRDKYDMIVFEKKDQIAYIYIDNQAKMNALSVQVLASLNDIFGDMKQDRDLRAVIISGMGRSFVAGADLTGTPPIEINYAEGMRDFISYIHDTFNKIEQFDRPVIAAINGFALGGGAELALCCDFRIASTKAKIGFPEGGLGAMASYGGPTRLTRLVGTSIAKEFLFSSRHFSAEEAKERGFLNQVVEPEELIPTAEAFAKQFFKSGPIAVKYAKIMVNRCLEMSKDNSLEFERMITGVLSNTEDQKEGMLSFVEKRSPVYKNL